MAYSTIPKTRRDGTIVLTAGASLTVSYENGDFSYDSPGGGDSFNDQLVIRDRTQICTIRKSDEQPITGSFSFYFRDFTDSEVGGVRDFITKQNAYSGNTSTGSAGVPFVEHYCVDITFEVDSSLDGLTSANGKAVFSKCVCTFSMSEGDPNSYSLAWTCYGGVTYTQAS